MIDPYFFEVFVRDNEALVTRFFNEVQSRNAKQAIRREVKVRDLMQVVEQFLREKNNVVLPLWLHWLNIEGYHQLVAMLGNKKSRIDLEMNSNQKKKKINESTVEFIVEFLLLSNGKLKIQKEITPLHIAANLQMKGIVKLLLDQGAEIEAKDHGGETPLHHSMMMFLNLYPKKLNAINSIANVSRLVEGEMEYNQNHRFFCKEVIQLLLEHGAEINAKNIYGETPLHILVKFMTYFYADDGLSSPMNPLTMNVITKINGFNCYMEGLQYQEVMQLLLDRGADITAQNNEGRTPLYHGLWTSIEVLGDLINLALGVGDIPIESVEKQIQPQGEEWRDFEGFLKSKNILGVELIKCLLTYGADINARDNSGRTPLHYVPERLEKLLNAESNSISFKHGILLATQLIRCLLMHGAAIDIQDIVGNTVLHLLVTKWPTLQDIQKILIEQGAPLYAKNKEAKSAVDLFMQGASRASSAQELRQLQQALKDYREDYFRKVRAKYNAFDATDEEVELFLHLRDMWQKLGDEMSTAVACIPEVLNQSLREGYTQEISNAIIEQGILLGMQGQNLNMQTQTVKAVYRHFLGGDLAQDIQRKNQYGKEQLLELSNTNIRP